MITNMFVVVLSLCVTGVVYTRNIQDPYNLYRFMNINEPDGFYSRRWGFAGQIGLRRRDIQYRSDANSNTANDIRFTQQYSYGGYNKYQGKLDRKLYGVQRLPEKTEFPQSRNNYLYLQKELQAQPLNNYHKESTKWDTENSSNYGDRARSDNNDKNIAIVIKSHEQGYTTPRSFDPKETIPTVINKLVSNEVPINKLTQISDDDDKVKRTTNTNINIETTSQTPFNNEVVNKEKAYNNKVTKNPTEDERWVWDRDETTETTTILPDILNRASFSGGCPSGMARIFDVCIFEDR